LVATDLAAKGLDFPDIKHVINFDMPKDVKKFFLISISIYKNIKRLKVMFIELVEQEDKEKQELLLHLLIKIRMKVFYVISNIY